MLLLRRRSAPSDGLPVHRERHRLRAVHAHGVEWVKGFTNQKGRRNGPSFYEHVNRIAPPVHIEPEER